VKRLGLAHIKTERLRALFKLVAANKVVAPVTMPSLMLAGFGDCADEMQILYELDQAGLRAALVIALAERT
jgi:hypothetical protein